jgi:outer membrane biosynthesis protein TonB
MWQDQVMFSISGLMKLVSSSKIAPLLGLIFLLAIPIEARASHKIANSVGPVIVSVSHPHDSRGEIVYENQGAEQKDQPVVTGTFIQPLPIELREPIYPKTRKKDEITVEGVIAQNGEFIDAKVVHGADPEFSQSALDAVAHYRFKPATLDGKAVAMYTRVLINFRVW